MSYSGKFKDKNNNLHPVTSVLYGTCDTAAATAAKVVTCSDFDTLMTGVTIRVKFANANTAASPTVNINSTGAKSVYRFGSTAPVDGNSWNAGEVVELVYDGTSFFMTGADDLSVKQNVTDNSLQTTDKTVVGAINEHEGDISSLKSGLTNLDNEVNGDATVYPYADVITIEDAVPSNLADCNVKIEPVQDLHGYDKPWVGGAGKNKVNPAGWSNFTNNGITYTVDKDNGEITISNTATANSSSDYDLSNLLPNTQYILTGAPSTSSESSTYNLQVQPLGVKDTGNGVTFTTGNDVSDYKLRITVYNGVSGNNAVFKPMVRLATESDDTWKPWSNICPITGHTEVDVQRDGRNLFDYEHATIDDFPNTSGTLRKGCQLPTITGQTYTVKNNSDVDNYLFSKKGDTVTLFGNIATSAQTFTAASDTIYYLRDAISSTVDTYRAKLQYVQLELGETATTFEDYAGKTYTIALGSTIYGGTVDFDSGVMTVDRAVVDLGDFTWENNYTTFGMVRTTTGISGALNPPNNATKADMVSDRYIVLPYYVNGREGVDSCSTDGSLGIAAGLGNRIAIRDMNLANMTPSDIKTAVTGYKLLYKFATPTTIQLTPQQIQLLQGQNTLTASTGQISVTANGVSGAIGSLTEEVNDHEERIEAVESGLDTVQSDLTTLGTRVNGIYTRTFYNDTTSTTLNNVYLPKTDRHTIVIIAGNDICTLVVSSSAIIEQHNINNQITVALNENNQFVISGCPYYSRPMFIATYDFR